MEYYDQTRIIAAHTDTHCITVKLSYCFTVVQCVKNLSCMNGYNWHLMALLCGRALLAELLCHSLLIQYVVDAVRYKRQIPGCCDHIRTTSNLYGKHSLFTVLLHYGITVLLYNCFPVIAIQDTIIRSCHTAQL